ncbi:MAG TPA: desulfoferrodoxin FeS4 iron-binding domain-containing protein, partial [Spirochaetota bacterium]|nr:desulfoferrodoxin FeS4 iron-binding domain-containing protein [Spirochaetota bacterium]
MTKKSQIYKCDKCGNIVEILHPGAVDLVCCGQ